MQNPGASPLLQLTFKLSPSVYKACSLMMGEKVKKRNMPRTLVFGCLFVAGALSFLFYLLFYLHQSDGLVVVMCCLLLLLGFFNLIYYPLLFHKVLERRAEKIYGQNPYFKEAVTLEFYGDYLEETTSAGKSRIQWTQVQSVHRGELFYLLQLTENNGIIIPATGMDDRKRKRFETLLEDKLGARPADT